MIELTFLKELILTKQVHFWNKDKSNYDYDIFLEKTSYELPKK